MALDKAGWERKSLFIKELPKTIQEQALQLELVQLEQALEEGVGKEAPPRSSAKFEWSSNLSQNRKAQRWWYANIRKGNIPTDGSHYKRRGKPPFGWVRRVEAFGGNFQIVIENVWKNSWTIFGRLGTGGARSQIIGHKRTGWKDAETELEKLRQDKSLFSNIAHQLGERIRKLWERIR